MLKFLKNTAHKIFGNHHHHHPAPNGPVPSQPVNDVVPVVLPVVAVSAPFVVVPETTPKVKEPKKKHHHHHQHRRHLRTKDTLREATFVPKSDATVEEKTKEVAPLVQEEKAPAPVIVETIEAIQQSEIIRKAQALQLKLQREPKIYEGEGKDAYGLNGAPVKSPFFDEYGNKKSASERTIIMDSLQKGEDTYKLKSPIIRL